MTERLSMRTIRDILRQRWVLGRPPGAISLSCGRSGGAVYAALRRARSSIRRLRVVRESGPCMGSYDAGPE